MAVAGGGAANAVVVAATVTVGNSITAPSSVSAHVDSAFDLVVLWTDNSSNEDGFAIERRSTIAMEVVFICSDRKRNSAGSICGE